MNNTLRAASFALTLAVIVWGSLAYFITAEDTRNRLELENRLQALEAQKMQNDQVGAVVRKIDRQLVRLEASLAGQQDLIVTIKQLRQDVTRLQIIVSSLQESTNGKNQ